VIAYDELNCPPVNRAEREDVLNLSLDQNYPNPVVLRNGSNVSTTFSFRSLSGYARLRIFDSEERERMTIFDSDVESGRHELQARVSGFAAGSYFIRLEVNGQIKTKRFAIVK